MEKRALHFVYEPHGSIGEISQDLIPYLKDEFELTIECEEEPKEKDILLCHFINSKVVTDFNFNKFKKKVLIQPIDGTVIIPEYVECLNQYDLILTPGKAGKTIMEENGVTTEIQVVRNYYKDNILSKPINCELKGIPKGKVIFYHESTLHPRKGTDLLLQSYVETFSDTEDADKVVLVIKDNKLNDRTYETTEALKLEIMKLQKKYKKPAKIIKITQDVPWETLKKLWYNTDIYVSLARIEGFGIPLLRMAVLEKPIVALNTYLSGYRDWLTTENSYLVSTKRITAENEFMQIYDLKRTQWAEPINLEGVKKALRQSLSDLRENKQRLVSKEVTQTMTLENIAKTYIEFLKKV